MTESPRFGAEVTPHMMVQFFEDGRPGPTEIRRYGDLEISPLAKGLHYGQCVFEGMKAFRDEDGLVNLFRPRDHLERMCRSGARVCLPPIDVEQALAGIQELIALDHAHVPSAPGSLYVRPVLFASEGTLCPTPARQHLLMVVLCPVSSYIEAPDGLRLTTARDHVRAAPGGTGASKCAGNYAAALPATVAARQAGFDEVVWLDATERRYLEEVGTMNLFVVRHGELLTPPLSDTILAGITRDTVMELARDSGLSVAEARISVDPAEWRGVDEVIATGTAAGIMEVRELSHGGQTLFSGSGCGPVAQDLRVSLDAVRFGREPDPHGWRHQVSTASQSV